MNRHIGFTLIVTVLILGCRTPRDPDFTSPQALDASISAESILSTPTETIEAEIPVAQEIEETPAIDLPIVVPVVPTPQPGTPLKRHGDEIVVAGKWFHTGTPVVLWTDPEGYDAYRVERKFTALEESSWEISSAANTELKTPNRFGMRREGLSRHDLQRIHSRGWTLEELQTVVDQFVLHFDACGTSQQCFKVLHDVRGLSVHFLLDIDGTIYQTLDLKERAWHATTSNSRSIGIEIANIGAYPPGQSDILKRWYPLDENGLPRIQLPESFGDGGIRTPGFIGRPARPDPVRDAIQSKDLVQYDFTPEQYAALVKLTASLCRIFPLMRPDYPKDDKGRLIPMKLPDESLNAFQGILGHYHIQTNKVDPGPAFDWEQFLYDVQSWLP